MFDAEITRQTHAEQLLKVRIGLNTAKSCAQAYMCRGTGINTCKYETSLTKAVAYLLQAVEG